MLILHWAPETSSLGSLVVFNRVTVRSGEDVLRHNGERKREREKDLGKLSCVRPRLFYSQLRAVGWLGGVLAIFAI